MAATDKTVVTDALYLVIRTYVNGRIIHGYNSIEVTYGTINVRITHVQDNGEIWLVNNKISGTSSITKFDLNDPDSIGKSLRELCHLLKQEPPSLWEINDLIDDPPAWLVDD